MHRFSEETLHLHVRTINLYNSFTLNSTPIKFHIFIYNLMEELKKVAEEEKENVATEESDEEEYEPLCNFLLINTAVDVHKLMVDWRPVIKAAILILICGLAFASRIFSVIRYESIIHEFDPWFNYRATQYLTKEGFYKFINWFDSESWYPLGRVIGGTVYPGIMTTAATIYWLCQKLMMPVDIRNVCVFLAPVFGSLTSIATYLLTSEITTKPHAGLFAAFFISIVPSYMSRSVAGIHIFIVTLLKALMIMKQWPFLRWFSRSTCL